MIGLIFASLLFASFLAVLGIIL